MVIFSLEVNVWSLLLQISYPMLSVSRCRVYIYARFSTHRTVITNGPDLTLKESSSTRTLTFVPKFTTCDTDQTDQPWMLLRPTSRDGTTNMKRETITRHVIPCGLAGWEQGQPKDNHRQPDEPLMSTSSRRTRTGARFVVLFAERPSGFYHLSIRRRRPCKTYNGGVWPWICARPW